MFLCPAARRVTNETYRWVSDARFHPSGDKVVATKWYTSSRSLGAGEGWEYVIPEGDDNVKAGSGKVLVGRTLPLGWTVEDYGDQQVGPEQFIWQGNDSVIYSKNTIDVNGEWLYSKGMIACSCNLRISCIAQSPRRSQGHVFHLLRKPDHEAYHAPGGCVPGWRDSS